MSDESLEGAKALSRKDAKVCLFSDFDRQDTEGSTTLGKKQETRAVLGGLGILSE
jgi:hypothetical protein